MYAQPLRSSSPDLYRGKYAASLFASGEQGVWYDPSDLTTMFQDAAGTTPVTGVEQPVGLILDKSKNGVGRNGAKRVNLANNTLNFPALTSGISVQPNSALSPDGTQSAVLLKEAVVGNGYFITRRNFSVSSGVTYKISVYAKSAGRTRLEILTTARVTDAGAVFNLSNGSVITAVDCTATIEDFDESSGMYQCCVYFTSTRTNSVIFDFRISNTNSFNTTYVGDGISGIYVWGIDLRLASDANVLPKYQPIITDWLSTIPGNHATQTTTASRPVLSARVNLLTNTEKFSSWDNLNSVVIANAAAAPNGLPTASLLYPSSSGNARWVYQLQLGSVAGGALTRSVYAKSNGKRFFYITWDGNGALSKTVFFDLINGTLGSVANGATASIFSVGNGWYKCTITVGSTVSADWGLICGPSDANNSINVTADGTSGIYLWGADLRVANTGVNLPAYQRVNTATDYDTAGFPMYLRFDGVDDSLVTPNINFTSTDKMTVFAGVRKLSDAANGYIVSLDGTSGTFTIFGPDFGYRNKQNYGFNLYGTSNAYGALVSYASPISNVLTASYDISRNTTAQEISVRVNQLAQLLTSSGGPAGTGNFGSWPLIIGRPRSWQLPFNGRLYGLIVRGAQTDNLHLTNVERYLANKSGVVL